jgi:hypothetical protein
MLDDADTDKGEKFIAGDVYEVNDIKLQPVNGTKELALR